MPEEEFLELIAPSPKSLGIKKKKKSPRNINQQLSLGIGKGRPALGSSV